MSAKEETPLRQEIAQALRDCTFWCQSDALDLAVEKIESIIDRERVKASLADKDFHGQRHRSDNGQ